MPNKKRMLTAIVVVGAVVAASTAYPGVPAGASVIRPIPIVRPVVDAPSSLVSEVTQPCVLYTCAAVPQLHIDWENKLASLPSDYCTQYQCNSPMDLEPDHGFDDNLFPFDPDWAYRIEYGRAPDANQLCGEFEGGSSDLGSPRCSSQPVEQDRPGLLSLARQICPLGRHPYYSSFHGHINWEPATYEGTLKWDELSEPGTDNDYSLDLHTFGEAGATVANPSGVHIEFDSDETIDHFESNAWWKQLHNAVDLEKGGLPVQKPSPQLVTPAQLLNGDRAVVTGLAGLDTAHDPALELHPVYAIAIQTDKKSAEAGGADKWAIFARSWGNEGFCSSNEHSLRPGPLTVRIPWQNGATGVLAGIEADPATQVQITRYDLNSNISPFGTVTASIVQGQGVLLTFDLTSPVSREPRYSGTVDLKWTFGPPSILTQSGPPGPGNVLDSAASTSAPRSADEGESSDVEAIAARLWRRLPRKTQVAALAHVPTVFFPSVTRPTKVTMVQPPTAPLRQVEPFVSSLPDQAFIAQGNALLRALCRAFRYHVQGFPRLCRPVRHA
jgi:hypothetical protein